MNKRTRQLLGQAYDEAVPETWTTLSSKQLGRVYEKFAELIVRECLKIVEPDRTSGDEWCLNLDETAQSIRQHFGVEE